LWILDAVLACRDGPDRETRRGPKHRMQTPPKDRTIALCSCGKVELEAQDDPIVSTVCYCESCQDGSRQIEALPNGRRICDPDGGTAYVLYRKVRIEYPRGSELLRGLKLRDESSTRRAVAACCGSPMFLGERALVDGVPDGVAGRFAAHGDARQHEVQARGRRPSGRRAQPPGSFPRVHGEALWRPDRDAAPSVSRERRRWRRCGRAPGRTAAPRRAAGAPGRTRR
jgi:hypothetical protein